MKKLVRARHGFGLIACFLITFSTMMTACNDTLEDNNASSITDSTSPYVEPKQPDSFPEPTPLPSASASATPRPTPTPTPTPTPSVSYQQRVLELVNMYRAQNGAGALTMNAALTRAAQDFAVLMGTQGFFSHYSPDGTSPGTRIEQAGYDWRTYGENIAYGQKTPEAVMTSWMNSSGHRANILNKNFKEIGVGYYVNKSGVPYWVQDFGAQ